MAAPPSSRLVRTQPWQDLAAVVWCGHARGRTSRRSFGAATAVAEPRDGRLARTRAWRDLPAVVWRGHGRGGTSRRLGGVSTAVAGLADRTHWGDPEKTTLLTLFGRFDKTAQIRLQHRRVSCSAGGGSATQPQPRAAFPPTCRGPFRTSLLR